MREGFAKFLVALLLAIIIIIFVHWAHHNDAYNQTIASYGEPIPPPHITNEQITKDTNKRCGWVFFHVGTEINNER